MTQERSLPSIPAKLVDTIKDLLSEIYPEQDLDALTQKVIEHYWSSDAGWREQARQPGNSLWSQQDNLLITYGNSVVDKAYKPLDMLHNILIDHFKDTISGVHILPFFPFTSDDGFAVTDYEAVNSALGDWADIRRIADDFTLMSDLVLNHVSGQSKWFNAYLQGHKPYDKYFFEASPQDDLSMVVRPRAHDLLREVQTPDGTKHVWCTFSHDQIDLNFANPEVLLEFLRIMRLHIDNGVRIIRLDAVAFIWKEIGTNCVHLPQTHAIIRLMRALADFSTEQVILLTETNVPNAENLSYFGNRNEAHAIYNFSLPPVLLHALLHGSAHYLNAWQTTMPPAPLGCTFLNFTASHDGIGMRPAEGLLPPEDIDMVIETVQRFGGRISTRKMPDGSQGIYELNIALFDALQGTIDGPDEWQFERFICSQTTMMALEGIPAFYIHSLLATPNDHQGVEKSGHNRAINRHRWDYSELEQKLADPDSIHARVLTELTRRIRLRSRQPAFHPNATQFTLQLGDSLFGLWRQSHDRLQSIFALSNVTNQRQELTISSLNLIEGDNWLDLLTGKAISKDDNHLTLAPYQSAWISNYLP